MGRSSESRPCGLDGDEGWATPAGLAVISRRSTLRQLSQSDALSSSLLLILNGRGPKPVGYTRSSDVLPMLLPTMWGGGFGPLTLAYKLPHKSPMGRHFPRYRGRSLHWTHPIPR
jgi:hypothetical protein